MKEISEELLKKMHENYTSDRHAKTMTAAMAKTNISELAFLPMEAAKLNGEFSIEIKTHGITAQEQSGRCWEYAGQNILREEVIKNCNLDSNFELSQNYIAFWDKLEKANNFLESMILYANEDLNSRRMDFLLRISICDGGWWNEFVDLVQKYGVVPKYAMPEVQHSGHTAKLLVLLKKLLAHDGVELRKLVKEGKDASARKDVMMVEFYKTLCIAFGEPPMTFDFSYRDKDHEYHCDFGMTPKTFYDKYVKLDLNDLVLICTEPSEKRPYHKSLIVHQPENMYGKDMKWLSLPIEEAKELTLAQMKGGELVWFACDAGQYSDRKQGYWDPASFDYEGILGDVDLSISKEDAIAFRETEATHAMVLIGVNLGQDGKPDRWKIENSWGTESGQKGYFVCSDLYFDSYVFEVIINRKYLSKEQQAMYDAEPIRIEPWEV